MYGLAVLLLRTNIKWWSLCLKLFSDLGFVFGTQRSVKMQAARSTAPVYSYFFAFDGGLGIAKLALHSQIEGKR